MISLRGSFEPSNTIDRKNKFYYAHNKQIKKSQIPSNHGFPNSLPTSSRLVMN